MRKEPANDLEKELLFQVKQSADVPEKASKSGKPLRIVPLDLRPLRFDVYQCAPSGPDPVFRHRFAGRGPSDRRQQRRPAGPAFVAVPKHPTWGSLAGYGG